MNKTVSIATILGLVVVLGVIFLGSNSASTKTAGQNVEVKEGVQYITITAKGGYTPRVSSAQAGIPTKLTIKTEGTFDCSLALVIRSIGFQKILPQTGQTEIDLGIPEAGVPVLGTCSMGMYNFTINFS